MEIEALRCFVETARASSFSDVARRRGVETSSISRSISGLEAAIGVRLLQRSSRGAVLTEAGRRFLSRVEILTHEFDQASDEAREASTSVHGTLRVGTTAAFGEKCLSPILPDLMAAHPDLRIEIVVSEADDMIAERLDVAIRLAAPTDCGLISFRLRTIAEHVVASPEWIADNGDVQAPEDLPAVNCLIGAPRQPNAKWRFHDRAGHRSTVVVSGRIAIADPLGLRACALRGLGPAVLPDFVVDDDLAFGRLEDLFPQHRTTSSEDEVAAWVVYPSKSYLPAKVRTFVDQLRTAARLPK